MTRLTVPAALAALLVAACALQPGTGLEIDGSWRLERGTHAGHQIPIIPGADITLTIDGDTVGGTSACNHYGGDIDRNGSAITFGAMVMTEMGCDGPVMASESAYIAALGAVNQVARSGDRLSLSGTDVELVFRLVPPVADAPIAGPAWILDSIISGDAVSSVMGEPATLELHDDGTLTGTTGCRTFDGRYTVSGATVSVMELTNDDRGCPDELMAQDEHVLDVINGGFGFRIDGERLTLTDGANGLGYRLDAG
jgi:heat shock protein HslJ